MTNEYPERDTWADGTMRSLASSFDTGAAGGDKPMIVPLRGLYSAGKTRISTQSFAGWFEVTWHAVRYQGVNEAMPFFSGCRLVHSWPFRHSLVDQGA